MRLRSTLTGVPAYVPGRPAAAAPDGSPAYKISSNENPYPPLPSVVDVVARAAQQMNRYPDMAATELVEAIAAHVGVDGRPGRRGHRQRRGARADPGRDLRRGRRGRPRLAVRSRPTRS